MRRFSVSISFRVCSLLTTRSREFDGALQKSNGQRWPRWSLNPLAHHAARQIASQNARKKSLRTKLVLATLPATDASANAGHREHYRDGDGNESWVAAVTEDSASATIEMPGDAPRIERGA